MNNQEEIKQLIAELLREEITLFTLKGKGLVNNAYYVETQTGKYIVKQEREDKEFQPQNSLTVEAAVIKQLSTLNLTVPIPRIVFISEESQMYGYEYIEGEMLSAVWGNMTEDKKIEICQALGNFHAEIGEEFTKQMAGDVGIKINTSLDVHPETLKEHAFILSNTDVPEELKILLKEARQVFDITMNGGVFQFLHNDAQHDNVLIKDGKISGIIDFGESEYGEVAKEFSRYIRDFPDHFKYIVSFYEEKSGNKLSYRRLVSYSLLSGFIDIVANYLKGGTERSKAESSVDAYNRLLSEVE